MESSFWFQGAEWKRRHRVQIWSKNTTKKSQPGFILLLGEILNDLRARNRNTPHPEGKCFTKPEKVRSWPLIVNRCPSRGHVWASARSGAGLARTASPRSCRKLRGTWKKRSIKAEFREKLIVISGKKRNRLVKILLPRLVHLARGSKNPSAEEGTSLRIPEEKSSHFQELIFCRHEIWSLKWSPILYVIP